jgi:hypothetical protein
MGTQVCFVLRITIHWHWLTPQTQYKESKKIKKTEHAITSVNFLVFLSILVSDLWTK